MFFKVCLVLFFVVAASQQEVTAITNWEFLNSVGPYLTDIHTVDDDVLTSDVTDLGDWNDELDFESILQALGVEYSTDSVAQGETRSNVGGSSCHCTHNNCKCCLSHRFSVKIIFKRISFTLRSCVDLTYIPSSSTFIVGISFNGRRMYHHTVSLRHPPHLCFNVPGSGGLAKVCIEFYNVNLARKSVCVRMTGSVDLKVKKFRVHLNLPCFHIPGLDEQAVRFLEFSALKYDQLAIEDADGDSF